jgi:DNA mismatch endonuclease (patch repair protein)
VAYAGGAEPSPVRRRESMADVFPVGFRSEIMSRVRSKGNRATELRLGSLMRSQGVVGWRRNQSVFGSPDFVFPKARLAVFVDGCFWHGCPQHCKCPSSNRRFWKRKLSANRRRDLLVNRILRHKGWHVVRIWQHDLRRRPVWCVLRIVRALENVGKNARSAARHQRRFCRRD